MKFGSKGDISPWIYVIAAVIGIVIVLYLLWWKGMLPFVSSANEADCTAYFYRVCQTANQNMQADPIKYQLCKSFASKLDTTTAEVTTCFSGTGGGGGANACEAFCITVLSVKS